MTVSIHRSRKFAMMLAALIAVLVGLGLAAAPAAANGPRPSDSGQQGNETCLACHQQPAAPHTLPSGETLDALVDPALYGESAHGATGMACTSCHTDITEYPHPENPGVQDARDYRLMYRDSCKQCHGEQYEQLQDSVHAAALNEGNENAPTCVDCHDPHTQPKLMTEQGQLEPGHGALIANTCAKCHSTVFNEYADSVHGSGVVNEGNLDSPSCSNCHGVHQIEDPTTAEFRLNSPELCASCHTNEEMMAKYDLSTDVMDTYVSDFHGTTVTLFEKTHPDQQTNKPVCYDCHGVHDIVATDDPERGLEVKENMLASCQKCHPDASENFSASWMSHYIASPDRYPLVYYVQLFYKIFIPTVLGGMGLFVLSDILRKTGITGRKSKTESAAERRDH